VPRRAGNDRLRSGYTQEDISGQHAALLGPQGSCGMITSSSEMTNSGRSGTVGFPARLSLDRYDGRLKH
jgi:hypothetical protein